ncbi:hypothetical protein [Thermoactinospora rubra]|uniref:hypothetical protein n=1 Tax=Thermoactinospora rubra TaxID=1088767 RepID=UPI000A0FE1F9|nr:hypothetical protein [Thermoactinospora rubra]
MRTNSTAAVLLGHVPLYGLLTITLDVVARDRALVVLDAPVFAVAAVLLAFPAVLVYRGEPLGALLAGLFGAPYLAVLGVLLFQASVPLVAVSGVDLFPGVPGAVPLWFAVARPVLLACAVATYLAGVLALPRSAGARPAPVAAALFAHGLSAGPVVVVLGAVAIAEHSGGHAAAVDVSALGRQGVLLGLAAVCLAMLAWAARVRGSSSGPLVAVGAFALPYLALLDQVTRVTPFPEGRLLESAPVWYAPALHSVVVCSALMFLLGLGVLAREPSVR